MRVIFRAACIFVLAVFLVSGSYGLMYVRLWGLAGTWPTLYWTTETAQKVIGQARDGIRVGMTEEEAIRAAHGAGARVSKIQIIDPIEDPAAKPQANIVSKDFNLAVEVARISWAGPSAHRLTIKIHDGLVAEVRTLPDLTL